MLSLNSVLEFFSSLRTQGLFSKDRLSDQIAILALYLPIIRQDIIEFVENWNNHRIRLQRNRPNAISGKPYVLFNCPPEGTQDYGLSFDQTLLNTIKQPYQGWDMDAYLPSETKAWCDTFFHRIGFTFPRACDSAIEASTNPFLSVYKELCAALKAHIESGNQPELSLLKTPVGSWDWPAGQENVQEVDLETDIVHEEPACGVES